MSFIFLRNRVTGGAAFSPASLFASGEEGAWYEPSTTTAFRSTTDLTPCDYGQFAGFLLDLSKGAGYSGGSFTGLGIETNGNSGDPFATVTPYRSIYGAAGPSLSGSVLVAANSPTYSAIGTDIAVTPGKTYLLEADAIISIANGKFRINDGTVSADPLLANVDSNPGVRQTYSAIVTPTVSTIHAGIFTYGSGSNPAVTLYSLSVRELPGNHATQATAAARPILARVPPRGRVNELSETDTLATQSVTVTAAERTLSFTGTGTVTLTGASTAGPLVGTGAGDRVSLTFTPSAGSLTLTVLGTVTDAQLELGASATTYQSVADSLGYDITEAGVTSLDYLAFDGSDDGMATESIDFTATDKMSVFAGLEPNSAAGAASETIVETSASSAINNGSFGVFAPSDLGGNAVAGAGAVLRGTTGTGSLNSGTYVGAAHVFSVLFDIAEATATTGEIVFRSDGSVVASSGDGALSNNAGTGNFGNYAMNIGARNNAAGIWFDGKLFSLIVRGAASTAQEISDTESYVANLTGVTL